ncbi:peptide chain release factor 2 [Peptococcaceae bacterium]|nr:peptide chain release factor 2 [Peptococcaceae bacterium]
MQQEFQDFKHELPELKKRLKDLRVSLDVGKKQQQIEKIEKEMLKPDFWNDEKNKNLMKKLTQFKEELANLKKLEQQLEDIEVLIEIYEDEHDLSTLKEIRKEHAGFLKRLEKMELDVLMTGKYDRQSAIITLHAGAGGTESQDWVEMLLRMYVRWAERQNYKVSILDMLLGDEAGIKSVTVEIDGPCAFGYLQSEKGIHRLVRISPFDAAGRRHTSFASVDVMPQAEEDIDIEIKSEDLKIDTFRAGGAGGQHVNKTDSAVRITHIPTGIVVSCQNERSQLANKNTAMKMLKAKLLDLELKKKEQELAEIRGELQEIAWGSQIRSYVFHPYKLVKDHRTNVEVGNVDQVMDGDIDVFISAYLKEKAKGNLKKIC